MQRHLMSNSRTNGVGNLFFSMAGMVGIKFCRSGQACWVFGLVRGAGHSFSHCTFRSFGRLVVSLPTFTDTVPWLSPSIDTKNP